MTVAELIAKLQEMPQDDDVIARTWLDGWALDHSVTDATPCFGGAVMIDLSEGFMAEGR